MSDLISVIVPAYNCEKYIDKCIRSIVSQTYSNIDVVVVDDGSSDSTPLICDEWLKKDPRIRVIHEENSGVTIARKNGVAHAWGTWICFVDSDDYLPNDALKILNEKKENSDVVVGQILFNGPYKWPYSPQNKLFGKKTYLVSLLADNVIHCGPVAKLFRKDVFTPKTFSIPRDIKCGEDFLMNIRIAQNVSKVRLIDNVVYNYEYRESSAAANSPFSSLFYTCSFLYYVIKSFKLPMFFFALPWLMMYCIKVVFSCFKRKIKNFFKI